MSGAHNTAQGMPQPSIKEYRDGAQAEAITTVALYKRGAPTWYFWYFALTAFYVLTLGASLALNFWESRSFQGAIDSHERSAELLRRTSELRSLALVVDAPGNDVFSTHDYVNEAKRLEVAAKNFNDALNELRLFSSASLSSAEAVALHAKTADIDGTMILLLTEARQVFALVADDDQAAAAQHMASMDQRYSEISTLISAAEQMLQQQQQTALAQQRELSSTIQDRGVWLLVAAMLVIVASGWYGHRVIREMRREALSRERTARRLARARDKAEQAARIKSQFLANKSHEIRTPMNGVLGMLEALKQTQLSSQQASLLRTAHSSADLLLSVIDDVLDFSKIEAGMLVIERVPISVAQVVQQVVSLYNVKALASSVQLSDEVDHNIPACVLGDPTRITQLLANFVSNAIKFSRNGKVIIRAKLIETQQTAWLIRFEVQDTGIGIDADAQSKLFTAFTQADNSTSRRFGGTGLGLAICKQLVLLLDAEQGQIGVQSQPGQGSTFFFVLRLGQAAPGTEIADSNAAQDTHNDRHSAARVLVAEDNEINQQVIDVLMKNMGAETVLATNGLEALDYIRRERFDLVLMDYHMPVMDGVNAARKIREWERAQQRLRTPIIAVTASVLTEDRELCTEAGMDDFLAKPIRRAALAAMLDKWLTTSPLTQPTTPTLAMTEDIMSTTSDSFDNEQYEEMRLIAADGFSALLEQFHFNVRDGLQAIRKAIDAADAAELKRAAHKLKGTSATLGAKSLAALCFELETMGKIQRLDNAMATAEKLALEYLKIRAHIEEIEQGEKGRSG